MTKREKVIAGLECCIMRNPDDRMRCNICPYKDLSAYCLNRLKNDALSIIKDNDDEGECCSDDYSE